MGSGGAVADDEPRVSARAPAEKGGGAKERQQREMNEMTNVQQACAPRFPRASRSRLKQKR
jgi:hypothetical protein